MRKTMIFVAVAALSMPALAHQPARAPASAPAKASPAARAPAAAPGQATVAGQSVRGPYTLRGRLTLFQMTNYNGLTWVTSGASRDVDTEWPIRSLSIHPGDRWQICARPSFRECIVIDRSVPDAKVIGIVNQIGSARPAPPGAQ